LLVAVVAVLTLVEVLLAVVVVVVVLLLVGLKLVHQPLVQLVQAAALMQLVVVLLRLVDYLQAEVVLVCIPYRLLLMRQQLAVVAVEDIVLLWQEQQDFLGHLVVVQARL
jgi:hypothetical protein